MMRDQLWDSHLVRIPNYQGYAFKRGNLIGSALRVTAGDQDAGIRMLAMNAAHGLARLIVGRGCHGTRVQDDEIGFIQFPGRGQTLGNESRLDRGAIGLRRPASEILDPETVHDSVYLSLAMRFRLMLRATSGWYPPAPRALKPPTRIYRRR